MIFHEYEQFDALGLAKLVADGEVSPRQLVESAIMRVEATNPKLNAVVYTLYDRARAHATGELGHGPFRGVPLLLKDALADMAGVPTSQATKLLKNRLRLADSELVRRLKRAGFVILGKTNLAELGILGVTEPELWGPTRNPYSLEHTTGGSSGGSAAAVAARVVPLAHGSDGGGSIRIPASACATFGLKPSRGRNPLGPHVGEHWCGLTVEHAITRSVRDSAALLDVTAGMDPGAPYDAPPVGGTLLESLEARPRTLRIAYSDKPLFGTETHPACCEALREATACCEALGHELVEAHPPFDKHVMTRAYLCVVAACVAHEIQRIGEFTGVKPQADDFETATWIMGQVGAHALSAGELVSTLEAMRREAREVGEFFEAYDVLLTPTMAQPPALIGAYSPTRSERILMEVIRRSGLRTGLNAFVDHMMEHPMLMGISNTMLFNMTGQPAASIPMHVDRDGLPIGVQAAARMGDEKTVLQLARQIEEARPWSESSPPVV